MARPPPSVKAKALACISQREHSRLELRRKLLAHASRLTRNAEAAAPDADTAATSQEEIEALLDWLATKDLLSESRFVELRVQVRGRRFGNLRIHQELAQHGLQLDAQSASALRHSELARAHAVWQKRFGARAEDAALRAKQMRFLMARGFSAEVVRRVVAAKEEDAEV